MINSTRSGSKILLVTLLSLAGFGVSQAQNAAKTTSATKSSTPANTAATVPVAAPPAAAPAASKSAVDLSKSSVTATFKQTGVSSDGIFHKFAISLDYNPAKITETKAQIDIDMSSFDIGDDLYNAEIRKKDWFNSAQFPKAGFVSSAVKANGPSKLDVSGKLTIKGKTVDVTIPVNYKQDGANTVFEGILPIRRLTFNIGEGEWKDTGTVEDEVRIKFKITVVSK